MPYSQDAEDFARSVSEILATCWGDATAAREASLEPVWAEAGAQGWLELGGAKALDFLAVTARELGRRACPFPVADAYVAAGLLSADERALVESGRMRVAVAVGGPDALLDGAEAATHLLVLDEEDGTATLHQVTGRTQAPGLAVPAWSRVTVAGGARPLDVSAADVRVAIAAYRLALGVRALGAAERAHRLAVEHATVRRQFGKVIGAFGAVQQRVAACEVEVCAAEALLVDAVAQGLSGRDGATLAADLAVQFVVDVATDVTFGAQHTLGAIGFFEEHEVSWLFRRVHADVLALREVMADLSLALVEERRGLPAFDLGPVAESFRAEVRAMLDRHASSEGHDVEALREEMADRAFFSLGWPPEDGGRAASVEEQVVLNEEMKYARGPVDRAMSAAALLGHSIVRHGTDQQKAEFLPLISSGTMAFCLGYSEPEAGSDLASLRTRAVLDPSTGEWVVDGQKSWTTRGHTATHVWLAARTDPDAHPRHAGITIFLVPMDTPGIQVQQHVALSGEISCTVFYDQVRVPDSMRVGEVNGGWKVITDALSAERVVMGGVAATLLRHFDDLLDLLRAAPARLGPSGSHRRQRLASVAARLQAARALVIGATRSMSGPGSRLASPMAAVLSGELAEDFGQAALELLGPAAALSGSLSAGGGVFDQALRVAPMYVIGGGTNDIQRGLIARGLGLPRE